MKLCPWPGLRQVPTATAAAVAAGVSGCGGSSHPSPSFCEEEEEEARGERGGRERREGDSRREGGGKNAEVLKGTLTFLRFPMATEYTTNEYQCEKREGRSGKEMEAEMERDMEAERWGAESRETETER